MAKESNIPCFLLIAEREQMDSCLPQSWFQEAILNNNYNCLNADIYVDSLRATLKNLLNWKTPGHDGTHEFWF